MRKTLDLEHSTYYPLCDLGQGCYLSEPHSSLCSLHLVAPTIGGPSVSSFFNKLVSGGWMRESTLLSVQHSDHCIVLT